MGYGNKNIESTTAGMSAYSSSLNVTTRNRIRISILRTLTDINQCDYGNDKLYTIKFYLINMNNVLFIYSDLT
jgi:hypothetical protein